MCVIAYKPKKAKFPSRENVKEMWESNPDGAGIMCRCDDGTILYVKGFMKLLCFEEWIEKYSTWLDAHECALHFRIATHGGVNQKNCHPFAIGEDPGLLAAGNLEAAMMHNGVLPFVPRRKTISDTAELALRLHELGKPREALEAFDETLAGNRIILMDGKGTHFFGDKFKESTKKENAGILYSNLNWESGGWKCPQSFLGGNRWDDEIYWDEKENSWRSFGKNVPFEDVDPCFVAYEDYGVWESQYEGIHGEEMARFGISAEEHYETVYEAEAEGFSSLGDYYADLCEERSAL